MAPVDLDRSSANEADILVYQVVLETGLPKTKIYEMIKSGTIRMARDKRGVIRIPRSECAKLRQTADQERSWKRCVQLREQSSTHRAAQKWVERKRASGIEASELLESLTNESESLE